MPIYTYHCGNCEQDVEAWLRSSHDSPICPECDSPLEHKLLTAASFVMSETARPSGMTCCGRDERCAESACASERGCLHH